MLVCAFSKYWRYTWAARLLTQHVFLAVRILNGILIRRDEVNTRAGFHSSSGERCTRVYKADALVSTSYEAGFCFYQAFTPQRHQKHRNYSTFKRHFRSVHTRVSIISVWQREKYIITVCETQANTLGNDSVADNSAVANVLVLYEPAC